jgi:hypothetical protein
LLGAHFNPWHTWLKIGGTVCSFERINYLTVVPKVRVKMSHDHNFKYLSFSSLKKAEEVSRKKIEQNTQDKNPSPPLRLVGQASLNSVKGRNTSILHNGRKKKVQLKSNRGKSEYLSKLDGNQRSRHIP